MSTTSKSPRRVAIEALRIGERILTPYSHRFSPKTFTQPQLLACLALKMFFKTDYRGIAAYLRDMPELCEAIHLKRVPHYTTLQKAAVRLLQLSTVCQFLEATARIGLPSHNGKIKVETAAADSTGFESGQISPYFVHRREQGTKTQEIQHYHTMSYTKYPKLSIICDCKTHLIIAAWPTLGPSPDGHLLPALLEQLSSFISIRRMLLDAGYDSHGNHVRLRDERDILSYIPPKIGRPTTKRAKSPHRRLMQKHFASEASRARINYGQRWQVETVFSMMKRNLSDTVAAREDSSRNREMLLKVITHNVMILLRTVILEVFYRAL